MKPLPPRPARGVRTARALALFAAVLLVEAVTARRFDLIDTPTLYGTLAAVLLVSLAAVAVVAVAIGDVWRDGAPGAGGAMVAAVLAGMTLVPFAGAAVGALYYPPLAEISTDTADPPRFTARGAVLEPAIPMVATGEEAARMQAEAYPDLSTRRLALTTVEAYAAARLAAAELGWTVLSESEPAGEGDAGVIAAEARALFLGVPDDVVIRILPSELGSRVDVRSASRVAAPDLGENARRIRAFFDRMTEITTRPAVG